MCCAKMSLRQSLTLVARDNDFQYAEAYFSGAERQRRELREKQLDDMNAAFTVPQFFPRPVRIFHVLPFKSNRADIFYLPDNPGLQVQPGDMVMVEGDRGQDL